MLPPLVWFLLSKRNNLFIYKRTGLELVIYSQQPSVCAFNEEEKKNKPRSYFCVVLSAAYKLLSFFLFQINQLDLDLGP